MTMQAHSIVAQMAQKMLNQVAVAPPLQQKAVANRAKIIAGITKEYVMEKTPE